MRRERGFTLMETLLAMALFAIVMTSGFGVFRMGLQIWQRMQGRSPVERKTVLFLEKAGRDIRTALRLPEEKESLVKQTVEYGGTASEFSFPGVVTKAGKKDGLVTQLGRITYRFQPGLKTLCKKIENASDLYLKKEVPCEPAAHEIQSLKFRYWLYDKIGKEYAWYDEWDASDGPLPAAVNVSLKLNSRLKGDRDSVKKEYVQTWLIPAGGEHS